MKEFKVECAFRNNEQIEGFKPYNPFVRDNFLGQLTYAKSAEEAIEIYMDALTEAYVVNDCHWVEFSRDADSLVLQHFLTEEKQEHYNFIAVEVTE